MLWWQGHTYHGGRDTLIAVAGTHLSRWPGHTYHGGRDTYRGGRDTLIADWLSILEINPSPVTLKYVEKN
jgi:hypothetical protein